MKSDGDNINLEDWMLALMTEAKGLKMPTLNVKE